ncbi:Ethyl tert-butyl ether degradation EthD (fragment) [Hyella patelloides LEGE 07179]|uniref:Ethyl tert-butyl ether degradation EthD n=1 Tax=Hyella patelloides LEGE 07179 TaxID=945734 RepID=A0A563VN50_9CYAN
MKEDSSVVEKIPRKNIDRNDKAFNSALKTPVPKEKSLILEPFLGKNVELVKLLFSRGEAFDSQGFITFFTDTPVYQFGNFEVCFDRESIKKSADNFFSQIDAVYHEIKMIWELGDLVFVEMDVIYWRKDGSVVSLPCCNIFRVEGDKFSELKIFMDVNPVFEPSIPVPDSASVFSVSQRKRLISPDIMKKHFAEDPEAKQRIETGFAPKWLLNGHNFSQQNSTSSVSQLNLVMEMQTAATKQDWNYFQTFFLEDVYFKVGASQELRGCRNIIDYLTWLYDIAEPNLPFEFRDTWELEDTVIVEMDAKYIRRSDSKSISFPWTHIVRFKDNKIREWRSYTDQSELWMNEISKLHGPRTFR